MLAPTNIVVGGDVQNRDGLGVQVDDGGSLVEGEVAATVAVVVVVVFDFEGGVCSSAGSGRALSFFGGDALLRSGSGLLLGLRGLLEGIVAGLECSVGLLGGGSRSLGGGGCITVAGGSSIALGIALDGSGRREVG